MSKQRTVTPYRFIASLGLFSTLAICLLAGRIIASHSSRYSFLFWNLFLAIVPAIVAWVLVTRVRTYGWLRWQQIVLSIGWLVFLPNSFYVVTDLIHLRVNYEADLLFDITLLVSFILNGLIMGYLSMYLVHMALKTRLRERDAYLAVTVIFLLVSFAICLGRYSRWNTWDIILQPAGLLFDVSDRVINPGGYMQTYQTTGILFLLLLGGYVIVYEAIRLLRREQ